MIRIINSSLPKYPAFILLTIFCFQACLAPSCKDQGKPENVQPDKLSLETFKMDSLNCWGYEILVNGKVYVHQEFVPALEGFHRFKTREEAQKVGKAVLKKMKNKQNPALTPEEVNKLLGSQ